MGRENVGRMRRLAGFPRKERDIQVIQDTGSRPQGGTEKVAQRVRLHYPEFNRFVDGMMLIQPRPGCGEIFHESTLQDYENQWRRLQEINHERAEIGATQLGLPGTVRFFESTESFGGDTIGSGILMTDLSKGGERDVIDLKDLCDYVPDISTQDWEVIEAQVERDLLIAEEEGLALGGGPSHLDSWLVVFDKKQSKHQTYIVDIGGYTSVHATPEYAHQQAESVRKALAKIRATIFKNSEKETQLYV